MTTFGVCAIYAIMNMTELKPLYYSTKQLKLVSLLLRAHLETDSTKISREGSKNLKS